MCGELTMGWLVGHLWIDHKIALNTNHGPSTEGHIGGISWVECLCGQPMPIEYFYKHVSHPGSPCRVQYMLMRGDM